MLNSLLALLTLVNSQSCPEYVCKSLIDSQCVVLEGSTVFVDECPSDYYCVLQNPDATHNCVKNSDSLPYAWPGEPCESAQCAYGYCNDKKKCIGIELNGNCSVSDECNPDMHCKDNQCQELMSIGDKGCTSDYDCEYEAGCMEGKCVRYYSIDESEEVYCVNNRSVFCRSGSCFEKYCLGELVNDNGEGAECSSNEGCVNTKYSLNNYPVKFHTECQCGRNGKKYCDLFPSDETVLKYKEYLFDWLDSGHVYSCNTVRRFAPYCIETKWHKNRYNKLMYYTYLVGNYTQVKDVESCVLETFNPEYYSSYQAYTSFSTYLYSTLAIILVID
jgi:hypothetical protein